MKIKGAVLIGIVLISAGCASGTPIDILIPTPKPSPLYNEYMGSLAHTNNVNHLYHSLSDTKLEKALLTPRKMELQGLELAAKSEMDIIDQMGSAVSNGIYGALVALAGLLGWQIPRPAEKHLVEKARMEEPPRIISQT